MQAQQHTQGDVRFCTIIPRRMVNKSNFINKAEDKEKNACDNSRPHSFSSSTLKFRQNRLRPHNQSKFLKRSGIRPGISGRDRRLMIKETLARAPLHADVMPGPR
jgi:hypothetical protein